MLAANIAVVKFLIHKTVAGTLKWLSNFDGGSAADINDISVHIVGTKTSSIYLTFWRPNGKKYEVIDPVKHLEARPGGKMAASIRNLLGRPPADESQEKWRQMLEELKTHLVALTTMVWAQVKDQPPGEYQRHVAEGILAQLQEE